MDDVVEADAQMTVDRPRDIVVESLPQSLGAGQLEAASKKMWYFPVPFHSSACQNPLSVDDDMTPLSLSVSRTTS